MTSNTDRWRSAMRWIMVVFYAGAGVVHLWRPDGFLPIVPDWVPYPREVILVTGVCELAGAVGLITRTFRWWAGLLLALYAACVFPANIKHAFEHVQVGGLPDSWWYHGPRFVMQPVLIWWALFCSGVVAWPERRRAGPGPSP